MYARKRWPKLEGIFSTPPVKPRETTRENPVEGVLVERLVKYFSRGLAGQYVATESAAGAGLPRPPKARSDAAGPSIPVCDRRNHVFSSVAVHWTLHIILLLLTHLLNLEVCPSAALHRVQRVVRRGVAKPIRKEHRRISVARKPVSGCKNKGKGKTSDSRDGREDISRCRYA